HATRLAVLHADPPRRGRLVAPVSCRSRWPDSRDVGRGLFRADIRRSSNCPLLLAGLRSFGLPPRDSLPTAGRIVDPTAGDFGRVRHTRSAVIDPTRRQLTIFDRKWIASRFHWRRHNMVDNFDELNVFNHIESQTSAGDKRSLLKLKGLVAEEGPFTYLEIGSHLG